MVHDIVHRNITKTKKTTTTLDDFRQEPTCSSFLFLDIVLVLVFVLIPCISTPACPSPLPQPRPACTPTPNQQRRLPDVKNYKPEVYKFWLKIHGPFWYVSIPMVPKFPNRAVLCMYDDFAQPSRKTRELLDVSRSKAETREVEDDRTGTQEWLSHFQLIGDSCLRTLGDKHGVGNGRAADRT